MRLRIEGFVSAFGLDEQARGGFEMVGVAVAALGLGLAELGEILSESRTTDTKRPVRFFAAAMQARFLDMQIAELLLIGEMRVQVDESGPIGGILIFELLCELDTALGVDGEFEDRDALQAPGGIGDGLHQIAFALADGAEVFFVVGYVLLVGGGIFGGKEDGAAGERCFEGI